MKLALTCIVAGVWAHGAQLPAPRSDFFVPQETRFVVAPTSPSAKLTSD